MKGHETAGHRLLPVYDATSRTAGDVQWHSSTTGEVVKCSPCSLIPKYGCDVCGRKFLRRQDLRRHKVVHQDSFKRFNCDTCGTTFARSDALFRHVSSGRCQSRFSRKV
ncbi:MAG: hypothetical protein SGCHY_004868 [Lobulomycetales sp.]